MSVGEFLFRARRGERVDFAQTQALIDRHYRYTPIEFRNGREPDLIVNPAGINEGSCKIFSFARLHGLDKDQTLNLFGDFYWIDVLQNPGQSNHANIRNFIQFGWAGIRFSGPALSPREPS